MAKLDRNSATFAATNVFNKELDSPTHVWNNIESLQFSNPSDTHLSKKPILGTTLFYKSKLQCNPFFKIELRKVCESGKFDPITLETKGLKNTTYLYSNNIDFEMKKMKLKTSNIEITDIKNYFIIAQVLDYDEITNDSLIGECLITFAGYNVGSDNKIKCNIYDPVQQEKCGSLLMKSYFDEKKDLVLEVFGIEGLRDLRDRFLCIDDEKNQSFYDFVLFIGWLIYFIISIISFCLIEKHDFGTSFYFRIVTGFTIGYGDIYPITNIGKLVTSLCIVIDTITIGVIVSKIMYYVLKWREIRRLKTQQQMKEKKGFDYETQQKRLYQKKKKFYMLAFILILYIIFGTIVYYYVEDVGMDDAFEWNFVTLSTVGYGDTAPQTRFCKIFTGLYIATGVYVFVSFGAAMVEYSDEKKRIEYQKLVYSRTLVSEGQLMDFDTNKDGKISKVEFLTKMLIEMKLCEQNDIDEIMDKFSLLDKDGSGSITTDELKIITNNQSGKLMQQNLEKLKSITKGQTKRFCGMC